MAAVSLGYWNGPKGYFKLKLYSSDSWMSNQKAALLLSSTNDQLAHSKVNDHKRLPICLRTGYPNCTELLIQHERAASSVTLTWVQGRRYTGFYAAVKTAHFRAVAGLVRGAFILFCSRAWQLRRRILARERFTWRTGQKLSRLHMFMPLADIFFFCFLSPRIGRNLKGCLVLW